jgi:adenylate cyclase
MAIEIERRFFVGGSDWARGAHAPSQIRQAYLALTPEASIRIRISNGEAATLTVKSAQAAIERAEFEYAIPVEDAEKLMVLRTGRVIEKQRHGVAVGEAHWEVDVFGGELHGLVIAEIELDDKDRQFERPPWLGEEITSDARYSNASLAINGLPDEAEPGDPD